MEPKCSILIKFLRLSRGNIKNPYNEKYTSQKSITDIQECSFNPKIKTKCRKNCYKISPSPKGYEKEIKRLSIASKMKERKNSAKEISHIYRKKSNSLGNNSIKKSNAIIIEVNIGKDKYF